MLVKAPRTCSDNQVIVALTERDVQPPKSPQPRCLDTEDEEALPGLLQA
jgi:hypothetical protein